MSELPTKSEMEQMERHKIKKVYDENNDAMVYKWKSKCRICEMTWCFCSESLEIAVREASRDDVACLIHSEFFMKETQAAWDRMSAEDRIHYKNIEDYRETQAEIMCEGLEWNDDDFEMCECDSQ